MKRCESDRILWLSVTMNGSSIFNVYFPVACHAKYEIYIMFIGILNSIPELMKRIMSAYWENLMQRQVHNDLMKFVTCYMRIMQCSGIRILSQITLTRMLIMVAKHAHMAGSYCNVRCSVRVYALLSAAPSRMLHAEITVQ